MVTPPAVAVIVFVSATVELKLNVAWPLLPVDAAAGAMVLPSPDDATLTDAPAMGLLLPSRTVTVMVLDPPAATLVGDADTDELAALTEPAVAVALKVAVPTPETTALAVLAPGVEPTVHVVLARPCPSVVLVSGATAPSATTQVTARPGIGLPWASRTCTTSGCASAVPAWPL